MPTKKKRRKSPNRTDYCVADRLKTKGRRYFLDAANRWVSFPACTTWPSRRLATRIARVLLGFVVDIRGVPLSPRTKASKKRTR